MPGKLVAVVNNKGGVGKTTSTVNLAHALTRQDKRVLVVDMDSQCNSTDILLRRSNGSNSLYEVFTEAGIDIMQCIHPTTGYERLDCVPNTQDTSALEPNLLQALPASFQIIRNRLRPHIQEYYDFALLDCPPNMGFLWSAPCMRRILSLCRSSQALRFRSRV